MTISGNFIEVDGAVKYYGPLQVLKGIDLNVRRSEVVCIIGPSGSGKSTLLRCIAFLEEHNAGEIKIEGSTLGFDIDANGRRRRQSTKRLAEVRQNVGMVFQQFNLWPHMTAQENVAEALISVKGFPKIKAFEWASVALSKVGLSGKEASFPSRLSGGQQQRVAIARALALQPSAILFDEPTSALDPELVGEVLSVMRTLANEGMTMVIVTHEIGFAAEVADRIVFMDAGQIVEQGPAKELLRSPQHSRLQQFLQTWNSRNALSPDVTVL